MWQSHVISFIIICHQFFMIGISEVKIKKNMKLHAQNLCFFTGTIFQTSLTLHGHFKKLTHD
jgi:inner membrane protein involved in colicin E2 resistance